MVTKAKSNSEFTRQVLCDAFCLLHAQMPINKLSVTRIAQKAGVDRTTFYQYFLDIDDLIATVEADFVDFVVAERSTITVRDAAFTDLMVRAYQQKQLAFTALLGPYGTLAFIAPLTKRLKADLPEVQQTPMQPYLSTFHLTTTIALFRLWLARKQDLPIESLIQLTKSLYLHGIQG